MHVNESDLGEGTLERKYEFFISLLKLKAFLPLPAVPDGGLLGLGSFLLWLLFCLGLAE